MNADICTRKLWLGEGMPVMDLVAGNTLNPPRPHTPFWPTISTARPTSPPDRFRRFLTVLPPPLPPWIPAPQQLSNTSNMNPPLRSPVTPAFPPLLPSIPPPPPPPPFSIPLLQLLLPWPPTPPLLSSPLGWNPLSGALPPFTSCRLEGAQCRHCQAEAGDVALELHFHKGCMYIYTHILTHTHTHSRSLSLSTFTFDDTLPFISQALKAFERVGNSFCKHIETTFPPSAHQGTLNTVNPGRNHKTPHNSRKLKEPVNPEP